jgi:spore germination protein GerM
VETISTADISAETVLTELKKRNVLPEAVSINNFHMDNGLITIDFNQAFADVVCSMGTSGELMVVGSVVNTFLDAFQAESVYFTVDGQILESGHVIYDFAMPFFSVDPQPAN